MVGESGANEINVYLWKVKNRLYWHDGIFK